MQLGALKRRYIVRKGPITGWIVWDTVDHHSTGIVYKTREQARKVAVELSELYEREQQSAVA